MSTQDEHGEASRTDMAPESQADSRKVRRTTLAAKNFFESISADADLFGFVRWLPTAFDYARWVVKLQNNREIGVDEFEHLVRTTSPKALAESEPGEQVQRMKFHMQSLLQMSLVRLVDNFQIYITELIKVVLTAEPRILYSRDDRVPLNEVLESKTREELLASIIDRKVNDLSYRGFSHLRNWCSDRGIEIAESGRGSLNLNELIATRNLIAHNRAIIDQRFLELVPGTTYKLGDVLTLTEKNVEIANDDLCDTALLTDIRVSEKFRLSLV